MTAKNKSRAPKRLGVKKQSLRKQGEIAEADVDRLPGGGGNSVPIKCGVLSTQY